MNLCNSVVTAAFAPLRGGLMLLAALAGLGSACQPKALTENLVGSADAVASADSALLDAPVDAAVGDSGQGSGPDGSDGAAIPVCAQPNPCHKYATCLQHPSLGPQCTCGPGFSGDGKTCTGCPPGYEAVKVDDAGVELSVCRASQPVWGARLDAPLTFQVTGLGTVRDTQTRLEWQQGQSAMMIWSEALTFCDTLAAAGHEDWRLPTIVELSTIYDRTKAQPAINTNVFGEAPPTQWVWTATKFADNHNSVWAAHNLLGLLDHSLIDLKRAVRCVRSDGEPLLRKLPRIERIHDDKVVKDLWTGREWLVNSSSTKQTLGGATGVCYDVALAGGGWRLPTVNELLSIVVYEHAMPAVDVSLFPDNPVVPMWTSVKVPTSTDGYFTVAFGNGTLQADGAAVPQHFRCVR